MLVFLAASGGLDSSPDAFSFTTNTGNTISTSVVSAPITPIGYNSPSPIAVTGTSAGYSINNGSFTSSAGTICPTQNVRVCLTTSASFSTTTCATLCIGQPATCGYFCATTRAIDATPDTFSLCCYSNVTPSTYCTGSFTVTGIDCTYVCALSNTTAYVCTPSGGWGTGPLCVCNNETIGYCVCTPAGFGAVATYCVCVGTCLACGTSTNLVITAPRLPVAVTPYVQCMVNGDTCYAFGIFDFCNNYTDWYYADCCRKPSLQCCCTLGLTCAQMQMNPACCISVGNKPHVSTYGSCRRAVLFGSPTGSCSNWNTLYHSNDCGCTWSKIINCCDPNNYGAYVCNLCYDNILPIVTSCNRDANLGVSCLISIPQGRLNESVRPNCSGASYFCYMRLTPRLACCCCNLLDSVDLNPYRTRVTGSDDSYYQLYRCSFSNTVFDHGYFYTVYATIEPNGSGACWCPCNSCITVFRSCNGCSIEYKNFDIKFNKMGCYSDYYFGSWAGFASPTFKIRTIGTSCKECTYLQIGMSGYGAGSMSQYNYAGFCCVCGTCLTTSTYDYYFGQVNGYNMPKTLTFQCAGSSNFAACFDLINPGVACSAISAGLDYTSSPFGYCKDACADFFSQNGLSVYYATCCTYSYNCLFYVQATNKNGVVCCYGTIVPCCITNYNGGSYSCNCILTPQYWCCSDTCGCGIIDADNNVFLYPVASYSGCCNHGMAVSGTVYCYNSTIINCCSVGCKPWTRMPWIWYICANGANNSSSVQVVNACNVNPNFSFLSCNCTAQNCVCSANQGGTAWACWTYCSGVGTQSHYKCNTAF